MLNFIENFLFKIDLKVVSIMKRKSVISFNHTGWAKPLENGFVPPLDGNVDEKCYFIGYQANTNNYITEFDLQRGPYFVPNLVGTNKKFDYNYIRGSNGQDTDKSVRVLLVGCDADNGSWAGSGNFASLWGRWNSNGNVGFFTTVKLD